MAKIIRMPEISADATSAVIKVWCKQEGEAIAVRDVLAEIETDKALIEFDADDAGILGKILVQAGQDVKVGVPIAVLFAQGETNVDIDALLVAAGLAVASAAQQAAAANFTAAGKQVAPVAVHASAASTHTGGRIFASPLARRLAKEQGMDLSMQRGTGPNGRIVKRDIEYAQRVVSTASSDTVATDRVAENMPVSNTPGSGYEDVAHSSMRRTIARRLSESKATIPHFYLSADCRMDRLIALRAEVNLAAPRKISINDFIVKAVAAALRELPDMNVSWTDAALRRYSQADISVAVSTESGLITPVVRSAETKALSVISAEIADLATRARSGKLATHEYQGGSFTISNLGMFGVQEFSAIINPPQAAILAVGATELRAVVEGGALAVASVMTVTLSVDHRAIDGALAAQWLAVLKRTIENPLSTLI